MNEPCKLYRETLAKMLEKYGGDVPDWKREPSCGCKQSCKRRQYIRQGQTDQKMVRYAYKLKTRRMVLGKSGTVCDKAKGD